MYNLFLSRYPHHELSPYLEARRANHANVVSQMLINAKATTVSPSGPNTIRAHLPPTALFFSHS